MNASWRNGAEDETAVLHPPGITWDALNGEPLRAEKLDQIKTRLPEDAAESLDDFALDVTSCLVEARPGDALLFAPGVFHKTQDLLVRRVAAIAEAC